MVVTAYPSTASAPATCDKASRERSAHAYHVCACVQREPSEEVVKNGGTCMAGLGRVGDGPGRHHNEHGREPVLHSIIYYQIIRRTPETRNATSKSLE